MDELHKVGARRDETRATWLRARSATSVGIDGGSLPAPFESLGEGQIAYDLIYGAPTPFLTAAWNGGADAHDGLGMLVQQAAASFEHWTGHTAPVDVMREAALG